MKNALFSALFGLFLLAFSPALRAQDSTASDENSDEIPIADVQLKRYDEAMIELNGSEFRLTDEVTINRESTLNIHITRLMPGSYVIVKIQKGGTTLKKHQFMANRVGEIELEVKTGSSKIKGDAEVSYTTSSGKKITRTAKVIVQ